METDILFALLIITSLAVVIPVLSNRLARFGIPIVVYEIIAGMIVGVSGFNLIEPSPVLNFLAEFGFAYLMFLSGLELDFRILSPTGRTREGERRWARPLSLGALILLGTLLLAFAATTLFAPASASNNPFLLGLILSTTSLGVVVPVVKERDLIGSRFGQYLLAASSIADFATLILLTIVIAIIRRGLTLDLLLIPTLLFIFMMVARFSLRASESTRLQRALNSISSATSQIRVRGAFALMVAWVVLAEAFGVEVILGAFLAGAIAGLLSGGEEHGEQEKLDAIGYGFFIPIFFVMVGVRFDLRIVFGSADGLILLLWLIGVAFVVKMIPALLLRVQFTWRQTLGGGMLLSSRLSLIIAASAIALNLGYISETVNSDIILLAIITVTIAPLLFSRIYPRQETRPRSGIIIVGQDQLADYIIERLRRRNESITAICLDQERIRRLQEFGVRVVDGRESYVDALAAAHAAQARVLVDLTSGPEETLEVCQLAKEQFGIPVVISRISDVGLIPHLKRIGVRVVQPELATAMALEGAIRYPTAFDVLAHEAGEIDVAEALVTNPQFSGMPLGEIRLSGEPLILSLQRGNTVMVPHRDTVVHLQDRLGLIGSPAAVEEAVAVLKG